ncbi:MAG: protein kinase [Gemmatimonadetes bacterium]|nr:protein kinase [Gemmatimonadota bacterium]
MSDVLARLAPALADRYAIERELGHGGMATVYLAQDLKHHRRVAIKVLRPELAAVLGAERFLREIEIAAQLSHPHILPLYDSGQVEGLLFYVMPHIEGESLRDRLDREKQLPIEEAVHFAQQVASALDYAHRHAIIHRDIKPENVLIHEGEALVADFGIALAVRAAGGERLTETGLSLGTPFYMSPEQATGDRQLDARSDIYSLGCVLYEMLAGEPPYSGPTAQAVVARILTERPRDLRMLRETVPPALERVVAKALAKLPADRYATAAEFADALSRAGVEPWTGPAIEPVTAPTPAGAPGPTPRRRPALLPLAPWIVAVLALVAAAWTWLRPQPTPDVFRFDVTVPDTQSLRTEHNGTSVVLSPDGTRLVYVGRSERGRRQLYLRALDQLEPQPLVGTDGAESPFFSPDGEWIAFFAEGKLKKVALAGGPPLSIADATNGRGGTWGPEGRVVFAPGSLGPLMSVSAAGGPVDTVTVLRSDSGETSHRFPDFLPGGKAVVFTVQYGARYRLAVVTLADGTVRPVLDEAMCGRWAPTGHLLYGSETGALLAMPFDARRLAVTGSPVSLLEGMLVKVPSGAAEFTVSRSGTLVYLTGELARRALVLVDRRGTERVLGELVALAGPRFSPDGQRIALSSIEQRTSDVRVYDMDRGTLSRLTFDGNNQYPEWTPDGRRVVFTTSRTGTQANDLYWTPADGSGEATPLIQAPGAQWEVAWEPDGHSLVFRQSGSTTASRDLMVMPLDSPRTPRPYLTSPFEERAPAMSPDGRWLAYVSNESGRDEVYVRAFPEPAGRWQVSVSGGLEPRWAPTGREIYYRSGDSLVSASVSTRPTFSVGGHEVLFVRPYVGDVNHAHFDVHPDNRRFVMVKGGSGRSSLIVALNWFEELRRRASPGRR